MMTVDMLGRTSTDDDSPVCSEAEVEAKIILGIKIGECLISMLEKGEIRQMGNDLYLLDTEATGHFAYDPCSLENYAELSRVLRYAGVNTFPDRGDRYSSSFSSVWGEGGLCDVEECCACSRPFPLFSVAETYCRCGEQIHRYLRGHTNSLCRIRR